MKREILFRGKLEYNGKWIYGDLLQYENGDVAIFGEKLSSFGCECTEMSKRDCVIPDTIGQYTGLKDKNGVKIFEGDIISLGDPNIKYLTMWRNDGFCAKQIGASSYIGLTYWASDIEVLGNVIDNPELIK